MLRLYVVVRRDLTVAQQAVQAAHAVSVYCGRHAGPYEQTSLILLTAPDEAALHALSQRAFYAGVECEGFYEPDLDGTLTALCLDERAKKLCTRLPLAFAEPRRYETGKPA